MKKLLAIMLASALALTTPIMAYASTAYTTDKLNIRKTPSTDGAKVGQFPVNAEVEVVEAVDGGWTKIKYKGETCYVKSEYLVSAEAIEKAKAAATQAAAESQTETKSAGTNASGGTAVALDPSWKYADYSAIHTGTATLYKATENRKGKVIGVNAGHGTSGGESVKTWCHPDKTQKVTGGSTAAGATKATAVSGGMRFSDGTAESKVTLKEALILKDLLLANGYDVLMIREGDDVQLDNIARTVICNNMADCHIAIHWDGDGLNYDKGCFYASVPDGIKYLDTVASTWQKSESLGDNLIKGLADKGNKIRSSGSTDIDLTQTSYSTVPSVDIELGNQSSDHGDAKLRQLAEGLLAGINGYFGY